MFVKKRALDGGTFLLRQDQKHSSRQVIAWSDPLFAHSEGSTGDPVAPRWKRWPERQTLARSTEQDPSGIKPLEERLTVLDGMPSRLTSLRVTRQGRGDEA